MSETIIRRCGALGDEDGYNYLQSHSSSGRPFLDPIWVTRDRATKFPVDEAQNIKASLEDYYGYSIEFGEPSSTEQRDAIINSMKYGELSKEEGARLLKKLAAKKEKL